MNGVAETSVENVKPFNDADGATWIGRSGSTYFRGDIADLKVWARPVNPDEIDDAADAVPLVDWEFEDESVPGVAVDSTGWTTTAPCRPGRLRPPAAATGTS